MPTNAKDKCWLLSWENFDEIYHYLNRKQRKIKEIIRLYKQSNIEIRALTLKIIC